MMMINSIVFNIIIYMRSYYQYNPPFALECASSGTSGSVGEKTSGASNIADCCALSSCQRSS